MFQNNLLQKIYCQPDRDRVSELISYLNYISGNDLKESIIRQYLFAVKWKAKENRMRSRCHCKAASTYLLHLLISEDGVAVNKIKMIIAEVKLYVAILDPDQVISFVYSTNDLPSALHYKHAHCLFYKDELPDSYWGSYESDLLVMYALRLALEKRIRGFLGIDYATSNGKPIGVSRLLAVAKSLQSINYSKQISWQQIEWVNSWLNHHMHRNLRPHPWIIHQAFQVLNKLLLPSMYEGENGVIYSDYASTVVSNEEQLTEEVLTKLEHDGAKVNIQRCNFREILVKKV